MTTQPGGALRSRTSCESPWVVGHSAGVEDDWKALGGDYAVGGWAGLGREALWNSVGASWGALAGPAATARASPPSMVSLSRSSSTRRARPPRWSRRSWV